MPHRDPSWLSLLSERPEAPFWDGVTRGEVLDAVTARAVALPGEDGARLPIVPAADPATVIEILAGLAANRAVMLLPRREPQHVQESLAACAGASLPGTVWVRSSGSLGSPRWIVHTPATLLAGAEVAAAHLDFGPGATWQVSLPLDHVGGLALIFRALAGGGSLTTANDASHVSLVATQLRRLLDGAADLRRRRCVLVGGGPVPTPLRREALAAGTPLVASYGLSETGALAAASSLDDPADAVARDHFAGRPLLAGSIDVDTAGNVQVSGPAVCTATAGDDGRAVPVVAPLPTGDLGRLDRGELFVTGRRDNVIISGGEKLPAEELEAALLALVGVAEAVVVPVDDAAFGQRPVAFLRCVNGRRWTLPAVREALAGQVAAWKLPVAVLALPEDERFKPDRVVLRRLAAEQLGS